VIMVHEPCSAVADVLVFKAFKSYFLVRTSFDSAHGNYCALNRMDSHFYYWNRMPSDQRVQLQERECL
jgi:hypothetical protein